MCIDISTAYSRILRYKLNKIVDREHMPRTLAHLPLFLFDMYKSMVSIDQLQHYQKLEEANFNQVLYRKS